MISDFFSAIENQFAKELPLVVYKRPGEAHITAILQHDDALNVVEDFSETGFVFAPFDAERPTYLLRPDSVINDSISNSSSIFKTRQVVKHGSRTRKFYETMAERAISEIKKGTFEKVVLSRSIESHCALPPLELFKLLVSRYYGAFCYLWYHPKVGIWLGATPEILLRIIGNRLTTMSLAGTKNYLEGGDPEWGAKEKKEQELVTDYIREALKEHIDDLEVSEVESVRAGNLWHLRTRISGLMKSKLQRIIEVLHPTPAVCGMPMPATREFILGNEGYQREFYTGFLGELNLGMDKEGIEGSVNEENRLDIPIKKKTLLFVNLRCLKLNENSATIYVGAGVTKDSKPDEEWEETVAKSHTMLDLLNN